MTSLLSLLIAIALTMIIVNYELSSADSIMQGVTLGVFSIMYLILVVLMTRSFLNEVYLIIFSYIVLASFFGIEVTDQLDPTSHPSPEKGYTSKSGFNNFTKAMF